jgi:predicted Fe-Mo cluster-binding NifX family protein
MKIALPIENNLILYKDNPHTAPKFAIYDIETKLNTIHFSLNSIIENQFSKLKNGEFDKSEKKCTCDIYRQKNLRHKCNHYSLLEMLDGCSYLLASKYCVNTKSSMKHGGIKIFKIPPIINKIDLAIKNFIIGDSLANQIKQIHHAS